MLNSQRIEELGHCKMGKVLKPTRGRISSVSRVLDSRAGGYGFDSGGRTNTQDQGAKKLSFTACHLGRL